MISKESSFGLWRCLNQYAEFTLANGENTIAVMGGTTMAMVAENMGSLETEKRHNLFVPARGGIGEAVSVKPIQLVL